ncbi:MAG: trehalose-6-phosphate synthase [Chloroflexi bacterium]|nr:trehalose-6-phosphate synthase [Chloroflexota bacterium]
MPVYRTDNNSVRLAELCQNTFANKRLIFVSNRGPIEFRFTDGGNLQSQRSGGGLMTSLVNASQNTELIWFASAMGEGDRRAAINSQGEKIAIPSMGPKLYMHFITSPRNVYHKYYNIFCNPLLWFLQHYMWNPPYTPNIDAKVYDAWDNGYVNVNKAFANTIINEIKKDSRPPVIMTQDYHLYLVNGYLRAEFPEAFMTHFIHIPWPSSIYWELLPQHMRLNIINSLCSNDIVGLQTRNDVANFLNTCKSFLPD